MRRSKAKLISDYDPRTVLERELVVRLASLAWRLRRATAIETGLLCVFHSIVITHERAIKTSGCSLLHRRLRRPHHHGQRRGGAHSAVGRKTGRGRGGGFFRQPHRPARPALSAYLRICTVSGFRRRISGPPPVLLDRPAAPGSSIPSSCHRECSAWRAALRPSLDRSFPAATSTGGRGDDRRHQPRARRIATRRLRMASVARPRQRQFELVIDHGLDQFANPKPLRLCCEQPY